MKLDPVAIAKTNINIAAFGQTTQAVVHRNAIKMPNG